MSSATIADLERQRAEVDAALAVVRRDAKVARQREKDAKKGQAKAWSLTGLLKHAVLIVYILTGYKSEPVVTFLTNNGRKRHWPERTDEELLSLVNDLFLEVGLEELAALSDMTAPSDIESMRVAVAYVEQWGVVVWTRQQNANNGVTPCTEFVLQRFEEGRGRVPENVRPRAIGVASDARARVRIGAWRRRWGGRVGRLRIREDVQPPELRRKAEDSESVALWRNAYLDRKPMPVWGTGNDAQFGPINELLVC